MVFVVPYKFRIVLSMLSVKIGMEIFTRIAANLLVAFGRMIIFIM